MTPISFSKGIPSAHMAYHGGPWQAGSVDVMKMTAIFARRKCCMPLLILCTRKPFPGLSTVMSPIFPDGPIVSLRSSGGHLHSQQLRPFVK